MLLLVFAIKILSPVFFSIFFYYIQFTNINKCKAGTSISADTKCVRQIIIYIKIQVILETVFTGVTSYFCHKNFIARFFIFFLLLTIKMSNSGL